MKNILLIVSLFLGVGSASAQTLSINRGKLISDMDGNQKSITNLYRLDTQFLNVTNLIRIGTNITSDLGGGNARGIAATDLQVVRTDAANVASGNYSVILGGQENKATAHVAIVVGGGFNNASDQYTVIVGGFHNTVAGTYSYIGSGQYVTNLGPSGVISGGRSNYIQNVAKLGNVIGGGLENLINTSGAGTTPGYSVISGGASNSIVGSGVGAATIVGGRQNSVTALDATAIGVGVTNTTAGSVMIGYFGKNTTFAKNGDATFPSAITSTNGVASYSLVAPVVINSTGWTNIWPTNNAIVYFDGTAMTFTNKNSAGTQLYTNALAHTGAMSVILQPNGAVMIGGTGVKGIATPF